jgi:hypothetical protein
VRNRLIAGNVAVSLLSDYEKRLVVQAVIALADAFEVAEKQHRCHHDIDVNLPKRKEVYITHGVFTSSRS